jgi:hypothetical protein
VSESAVTSPLESGLTSGVPGHFMDWFIARNGRAVGPLTFEALVDAALLGHLDGADYVWHSGAKAWQRADEVAALWAPPIEPPPPPRRRTNRITWLQVSRLSLSD